jgi:DNA-binding beta-propeller fold protein YncE
MHHPSRYHHPYADEYMTCSVSAVAGRASAGYSNRVFEWALFSSPAGLASSPDGARVYLADTNNNALRLLDMTTRE